MAIVVCVLRVPEFVTGSSSWFPLYCIWRAWLMVTPAGEGNAPAPALLRRRARAVYTCAHAAPHFCVCVCGQPWWCWTGGTAAAAYRAAGARASPVPAPSSLRARRRSRGCAPAGVSRVACRQRSQAAPRVPMPTAFRRRIIKVASCGILCMQDRYSTHHTITLLHPQDVCTCVMHLLLGVVPVRIRGTSVHCR